QSGAGVPVELADGNTGTVFVSSGKGLASCEFFGFWSFGAFADPLGDDGVCCGEEFPEACAAPRFAAIAQQQANANAARKTRLIRFCDCCFIVTSMVGCEAWCAQVTPLFPWDSSFAHPPFMPPA